MKAIFIGSKLATTTFLSFDIRTIVGPLEDYLQNLKSLRSLRDLLAIEVEGFEASAIFPRDVQKNTSSMSAKCAKKEEAEKCTKKIHSLCLSLLVLVFFLSVLVFQLPCPSLLFVALRSSLLLFIAFRYPSLLFLAFQCS